MTSGGVFLAAGYNNVTLSGHPQRTLYVKRHFHNGGRTIQSQSSHEAAHNVPKTSKDTDTLKNLI